MSTARIPGFYNLPIAQRFDSLLKASGLTAEELAAFQMPSADGENRNGLTCDQADHMVENAIGTFALPLGIGLNFMVNGREVLVPMAIEEPSVIAGASFMAKLARSTGGFTAETSAPEMIGQMQVLEVDDPVGASMRILEHKAELLAIADAVDPVLKQHGGGARDLEVRLIEDSPIGTFIVLHLIYNVGDAMGANAVNTACEKLAPQVEAISGGRVHLKILSNLADRRLARSTCTIPVDQLAFDDYHGEQVRDGIIAAWAFAAADPYRAATHNKGIMNGVDAVVIATGNDWRAIEAGAHAYAARSGQYTSLSTWSRDDQGHLRGELVMPLAVGIIGGATRVHPGAKAALKLMNVHTAAELAGIIASVGLAQNLAALRALATEGIQRGHMTLHARQVAIAAGASGAQIEEVAARMVAEKLVRLDRAEAIIKELNKN